MNSPEQIVEELFRLRQRDARKSWFTKPRLELEPALRAAFRGWETGAGDEFILAALLHGIGPRLVEKGLPSLESMGFSPRVAALAEDRGDEADQRQLTALFEGPLNEGQAVPALESYRALAMGHLDRLRKK